MPLKSLTFSSRGRVKLFNHKGTTDAEEGIRAFLRKLRERARRSGLWWRLERVKRGILDLCISLPIHFKSRTLLRALVEIVKELENALNPLRKLYMIGIEEAWRASEIACSWGYREAYSWRNDRCFAIYWGSVISSVKRIYWAI